MKPEQKSDQTQLYVGFALLGCILVASGALAAAIDALWLRTWFYLAAGSVAMAAAAVTIGLLRLCKASAVTGVMAVCLTALALVAVSRFSSVNILPARLLEAGSIVGRMQQRFTYGSITGYYWGLFTLYVGVAYAVACPVLVAGIEALRRYWRLKYPAPEPTRGERCRSFRPDEFKDYAHPGRLLLGRDRETGHDFLIPAADLNVGGQLTGTTGSGKTNLLLDLIRQWPGGIIFYDGKGDPDLCRMICADASRQTIHHPVKTFRGLFFNAYDLDRSSTYNPLIGDAHSQAAMLKQSFSWSEIFYEKVSERQLVTATKALKQEIVTVAAVLKLIDPCDDSARILSEQLRILTDERFYPWLDTATPEIRMENAFLRDEVLVFSIANDLYKHSAAFLTHMFLQDLLQTANRLVRKGNPTLIIIDEASVILKDAKNADSFVQLINKIRSAGGCVVVSTQSIGDYAEEFRESLSGNLRTKIVGASAENLTPDYFSNLFGTRGTVKKTLKADEGLSGMTASGDASLREVREFCVPPDDLKNLQMGQWVVQHNKRTYYLQNPEVRIEPLDLPERPVPVATAEPVTQPGTKPVNSDFD